ncbi:hypothetical protein IIA95_01720 [Patescibacteria group bacterium]|nr:hypothetical protein [Patescibacteria group bacterium]
MDDIVRKEKKRAEKIEPEMVRRPPLLSWSAPEYEYTAKSREWYWVVGILATAFVVVAILIGNFLFAIFIILTGFTIALYGARRPKVVAFALTHRGIQIADRLYPYDTLKSFWIRYDPPRKKEIDITSKKIIMPRLTIPLADTDPNEARNILIRSLKEEETEESLSEAIAKYLGF